MTQKVKVKKKMGAPTKHEKADEKLLTGDKFDSDVVNKLREAFSVGGNITLACSYADISRETYYKWVKLNPNLSDEFERLRNKPILKSLSVVVSSLDDPDRAQWYLERRFKEEFSTRQELAAPGGSPLLEPDPETKAKIDRIFNKNLKRKK